MLIYKYFCNNTKWCKERDLNSRSPKAAGPEPVAFDQAPPSVNPLEKDWFFFANFITPTLLKTRIRTLVSNKI